MSELSEVVAGQVNERFLEVPTNSTYFADLATLNAAQVGAQNPFDAVVREVVDLRAAAGNMSAFDSRYAPLPGAWTTYTPAVRSGTGTITSATAVAGRYAQLGKLVTVYFTVTITTRGTAGGFLYLTVPVNATASTYYFAQLGTYREILNTGVAGGVCFESATEMVLAKNDFTSPFGTNGDVFRGSFTYEAA